MWYHSQKLDYELPARPDPDHHYYCFELQVQAITNQVTWAGDLIGLGMIGLGMIGQGV